MHDEQPPGDTAAPKRTRLGLKVALVGAGLAAGVVTATAFGASAATAGSGSTSSGTTGSTSSSSGPSNPGNAPQGRPGNGKGPAGGHGGANPVRSDEKSVSTADAAKLKAAALAKVPGGTVYRVETDAGDGEYEVHMTKSDGSLVTVKFDKNLNVTKVETGMGTGDPAPSGQQPQTH